MIAKVQKIGLEVDNQKKAVEFWSKKLGFRVMKDLPYDPEQEEGPRWIELRASDVGPDIVLAPRQPGSPNTSGQLGHIIFECKDLKEAHDQMVARGVEFENPPTRQMWGLSATFLDPEGTRFVLNEAE